jgi:tetratricopeptide (TPR) repeat protein
MKRIPLIVALVVALFLPASVALSQVTGAATESLGKVNFQTSCTPAAQAHFLRGVAMLHSFWLDAAIKEFSEAAQVDNSCAIAGWGVAMAWMGNPLAGPPSARGLKEGGEVLAKAKTMGAKTQRERDYLAAIENIYRDADKIDHRTRALAYEKAMAELSARYPDDREAAVFYALALNMTLNPNDKTYANQLKAAGILEKVFAAEPQHPGVAHYLIHSYDFPPIAAKGLTAARRYASIAPAAPHAQHMPAHIFTRVGSWQESIDSNRASARAAQEALRDDTIGLRSYESLHANDYMMYAFMQLAKDREAKALMDEIGGTRKLNVDHFAGAFALAAIPARYTLERGRWADAAALTPAPSDLGWDKFPQAESIVWFARGIGAARSGNVADAGKSQARIEALRDALKAAKNTYWAEQSDIQRLVVAGWIARAEGKNEEAVALMRQAADREDATEKHPVTPGALFPAREMLANLLLDLGQPAPALAEFERSQKSDPNRFRGLAGAARAAELAGDRDRARGFYTKLTALAATADTERPELTQAKAFLMK